MNQRAQARAREVKVKRLTRVAQAPVPPEEEIMAYLEVIARAKVRPGQLEGVKAQAAEIVRVTREQDTHTLRCDWFLNEDGTECEVHEMFPDEQGLIEHQMHIMEARMVLFRDYAYDHRSTIYGESQRTSSTSSKSGWGRHQPSSRSCRDSNGRQRSSQRRSERPRPATVRGESWPIWKCTLT